MLRAGHGSCTAKKLDISQAFPPKLQRQNLPQRDRGHRGKRKVEICFLRCLHCHPCERFSFFVFFSCIPCIPCGGFHYSVGSILNVLFAMLLSGTLPSLITIS